MTGKLVDYSDYDLYGYFYSLVRQIPEGMVTTYGALARALGDVVAARACGYMLSINPDPVGTPCYKVVRSDGSVGKFTHPDGSLEKIRRLGNDGVRVEGGTIPDFDKALFEDFQSTKPLEAMKKEQEEMGTKVSQEDEFTEEKLAAVDVSYDDFTGYGAMVVEEDGSIEVRRAVMPVTFPYIPGYLSYREFKFIRELSEGYDGLLLVDANGYLHPRHIGLASFAGMKLGIPTIGVAKSLLTGKKEGKWITMNEERVAYQMNGKAIVSVGNRVSLDSSIKFLKARYGDSYPRLLKMAHDESVKLRVESGRNNGQQKVAKSFNLIPR